MKAEPSKPGREAVSLLDAMQPIPAEKLLNKLGAVQIVFKGQIYTLRQTRNDKLILTK